MPRMVNDFYQVAEDYGIPVYHFPLPAAGSLSIELGDTQVIGMDSTRPMTRGDEQAHLGHELGHCLYGGFYTIHTPYDVAEQHEVRADHWYINRAIPRQTLFELLRSGYDVWEIAELLNTTEDYVRQAYYYYRGA